MVELVVVSTSDDKAKPGARSVALARATPPPIAFLGLASRASSLINAPIGTAKHNLLELRREVVSSIYPLPLGGSSLVFAIYQPYSLGRARIIGESASRGDLFWVDIGFETATHPSDVASPAEAREFVLFGEQEGWLPAIVPFPKQGEPFGPDLLHLHLEQPDNSRVPLGHLQFLYQPAAPLTEDRIAAIRSDPNAADFIRLAISCTKCSTSIWAYAGLERQNPAEEGHHWYQDLPLCFECKCSNVKADLRYLRKNLHSLVGHRRSSTQDEEVSFVRLYELSALQELQESFRSLLEADPTEPDVQEFLEKNPVFLHPFAPRRLFPKAPILNRFQTDFAILSETGDLVLVELERPGKRILRADGHRSAHLTHAFDQVEDWLRVVDEHRAAALEMIGLERSEVGKVRGVVIMGRNADYKNDHLRKMKSIDFGRTTYFTYDDLLESHAALVRQMRFL